MTKPVRHAISVVITNKDGDVLFAKRSASKSIYPLAWSLPSHYVAEGEEPVETVSRIGRNKLGVSLIIGKLVNEGLSELEEFSRFMHVYEAEISQGEPQTVSDDYTELKWAEPRSQLDTINIIGDCCRLYKESLDS